MSQANIVAKLVDQFSPGCVRMADANRGFTTSLGDTSVKAREYSSRIDAIIKAQSNLQKSLAAAKKDLKAAQRTFDETGDAADSQKLDAANEKYNGFRLAVANAGRAAKEAQRDLDDLRSSRRKLETEDGAAGTGGGSDATLVSRLGAAGATAMVGDLVSQAVGTFAGSALGDVGGNYVTSALSSAGLGASIGTAIGSVIPGIGTAIGAALGGLGGLVKGKMDEVAGEDAAYKGAVQDTYGTLVQAEAQRMGSGTDIAARREMDQISFTTLFGDAGAAEGYLEELKDMANTTPFLYDDLTSMSKTLKTFGYGAAEMIPAMTAVGDAGAALGMGVADMNTVSTAIGRMRSTDKASLEYLNQLTERGLDVVGWVAQRDEKTKGEVYDAISKGAYSGADIAQLVLDQMQGLFGGSMALQSETYGGLSSTLQGMNDEMANAQGAGYNDQRKEGMEAQIAFLGGQAGQQMQEAYRLMGQFQADLENQQEALHRDALTSVMNGYLAGDWAEASEELRTKLLALGEDYDKAALEDNGAEMGRVLKAAEAMAQAEYQNTEGYRIQMEADMRLVDDVQEAMAGRYEDYGYAMAQQFTTGYQKGATGLRAYLTSDAPAVTLQPADGAKKVTNADMSMSRSAALRADLDYLGGGFAYGLERVPRDNFPALLHEGERVLTASQARQQDRGGGSVQIGKIADNVVIREEADIYKLAAAVVEQVAMARLTDAGVY